MRKNYEKDIFYISLREHATIVIDFEKKNVTVNRKRAKITSRFKRILHL